MRVSIFVLVGMLTAVMFSAFAEEKTVEKPTLYMKHIQGWYPIVLAELTVHKDGTFIYKTHDRMANGNIQEIEFKGKIPQTELKAIIQTIAAAEAAVKGDKVKVCDAGSVDFRWLDKDGKEKTKSYNDFEGAKLLEDISNLAKKYGKKNAKPKNPPVKK